MLRAFTRAILKPKKNQTTHWRDLCAKIHDDDGLAPSEQKKQNDRRADRASSKDRSTQRLCAQAQRAIRLALLADCQDEVLQALEVTHVEPWPDAKRLRVHLSPPSESEVDVAELYLKAQAVCHLLRDAVAQRVTRKRAPRLVIVVEPRSDDEGSTGKGGDDATIK